MPLLLAQHGSKCNKKRYTNAKTEQMSVNEDFEPVVENFPITTIIDNGDPPGCNNQWNLHQIHTIPVQNYLQIL